MRTVGLDRRKRLMLDEPHRLNKWEDVVRARSEIAQKCKKDSVIPEFIAWAISFAALTGIISLCAWLVTKGVK